jgi:ribosomal protein S18 acetylase RimI-like enzyme
MKSFSDVRDTKKRIRVVETTFTKLSEDDQDLLEQFVEEGGQMVANIRPNLQNAKVIVILYDGDNIIGLSSIKSPSRSYVETFFDILDLDYDEETDGKTPYEFGLTYILPNYRGVRLVDILFERRIRFAKENLHNGYFFCTIRTNNQPSLAAAKRNGFEELGTFKSPYSSNYLMFLRHQD